MGEATRPLIGLTGRRKLAAQVAGFPASLDDLALDVFVADYARGVLEAGGLPVFLPLDAPSVELVDHLDGVVLTGGADLGTEDARDGFELAIVDRADELALPVLGICRGMQLLNVHGGGSLHEDVPTHARYDVSADTLVHELDVRPGTVLHELHGDRVQVNSLHHQTIDRLADGWVVSASAADGTVEAIERPGREVLAVQWHPEMMRTRPRDALFTWLVSRAAANRADGPARGAA